MKMIKWNREKKHNKKKVEEEEQTATTMYLFPHSIHIQNWVRYSLQNKFQKLNSIFENGWNTKRLVCFDSIGFDWIRLDSIRLKPSKITIGMNEMYATGVVIRNNIKTKSKHWENGLRFSFHYCHSKNELNSYDLNGRWIQAIQRYLFRFLKYSKVPK